MKDRRTSRHQTKLTRETGAVVRARGVDTELATPTAPPTRPALVLVLAHQALGVHAAVAGAAAEQMCRDHAKLVRCLTCRSGSRVCWRTAARTRRCPRRTRPCRGRCGWRGRGRGRGRSCSCSVPACCGSGRARTDCPDTAQRSGYTQQHHHHLTSSISAHSDPPGATSNPG